MTTACQGRCVPWSSHATASVRHGLRLPRQLPADEQGCCLPRGEDLRRNCAPGKAHPPSEWPPTGKIAACPSRTHRFPPATAATCDSAATAALHTTAAAPRQRRGCPRRDARPVQARSPRHSSPSQSPGPGGGLRSLTLGSRFAAAGRVKLAKAGDPRFSSLVALPSFT